MSSSSIYWYDFETFGANPQKDRVCQFAGVRTDENLNIIGDPLVIFCKPSDDFLPNPFACLITGITPQTALAKGSSLMMSLCVGCCIAIYLIPMNENIKIKIHAGILLIWCVYAGLFALRV